MQSNVSNTSAPSACEPELEPDYYYASCEVVVAVLAIIGNALVIHVFIKERRLRRRTNYYIVSLAVADLFVGLLGIPFAILSSLGLPKRLHICLFTVSLLVVLCTVSIFSLVAVSLDRYWAILHPMGYSRNVRTRTALAIIGVCWAAGFIIGLLPLMGWHQPEKKFKGCFFLCVMDYHYLVFLFFGTIITPALVIAAFYAHIYQVVLKQIRRTVHMHPDTTSSSTECSGGTMLRTLGAAQTREVKATQNLAIIVLFFMICWIPLYTINCIIAFCEGCHIHRSLTFFCVILSHLNSAVNPLLYAYHLKDFRLALKNFLWKLFGYSGSPEGQVGSLVSHSQYNNFRVQPKPRRAYRSNIKMQRFTTSKLSFRNTSLRYSKSVPDIETIITATAKVAVVSAGELNKDIWKISEASTSSESFRGIENIRTKFRPGTPFRHTLDGLNRSYIDNSHSSIEDDDVFLHDMFEFNDYTFPESDLGTSVCDTILTSENQTESPQVHRTGTNASSAYSPKVFFIEDDSDIRKMQRRIKSLDSGRSPGKKRKTGGSFKLVQELLHRKKLSRSLSDEATASSDSSGNTKTNDVIYRNSCGC